MKLIEHNNADKLPQGAQSHDSPMWHRERVLMDWRGLSVVCFFLFLLILFVSLRYDWSFFAWVQYGGGGWVPWAVGVSIILFLFKAWALQEQPGGYKMFWIKVSKAGVQSTFDEQRVIDGVVKAMQAYSARPLPNVQQVTFSNTQAPMLEDDENIIEAELLEPPVALIPDSDWLQWIDRTPHLLLAGRTDAGKTTFAEAILSERIQAGDQIVICDPHYQPGKWHGVEATSDVEQILTLLAQIEIDMVARFTDFIAGKPTEDFQRLTILIDEVPAVVEETFRMTPAGTKKIVDDRWSRFARRLGSQARKVRISVILLSQTIFVEDLMINSAYRENFVRVGLGDKARPLLAEEKRNETKQQLYDLLRGQAHPAAFEHNGEVHLLDTSRVPALAARRNGHMAQLWAAPAQAQPRMAVSAAAVPSQTVSASIPAGAIVYPAKVQSTTQKIAWLLGQKYTYRQIEKELSVSHATISDVSKRIVALRALRNGANSQTNG